MKHLLLRQRLERWMISWFEPIQSWTGMLCRLQIPFPMSKATELVAPWSAEKSTSFGERKKNLPGNAKPQRLAVKYAVAHRSDDARPDE